MEAGLHALPTSAVSCRCASFAAAKCWLSSSFSMAYYGKRKHTELWMHPRMPKWTYGRGTPAGTHRFGLFLQVHDLGQEMRDLLLLAGGILRLFCQLLRDGCDLEVGISYGEEVTLRP